LPGIFVAAIIFFFVREPERRVLKILPITDDKISIREAATYLYENRRAYLPIYAGFSIHAIAVFAVFAWLPTQLMREFEYSVTEAGNVVGLSMLFAGCAGALAGGGICDRLFKAGHHDAPLILGL